MEEIRGNKNLSLKNMKVSTQNIQTVGQSQDSAKKKVYYK